MGYLALSYMTMSWMHDLLLCYLMLKNYSKGYNRSKYQNRNSLFEIWVGSLRLSCVVQPDSEDDHKTRAQHVLTNNCINNVTPGFIPVNFLAPLTR